MAEFPYPEDNFIHSLSAFWTSCFEDTDVIQRYFSGVQLNMGQLYLNFLEYVLSSSLENAPAFSKRYYKLFQISEDELNYEEGPSSAEDVFVYKAEDLNIVDVPVLMNNIIEPTIVFESGNQYTVTPGALRFKHLPFNSQFAQRHITKIFPACYVSPISLDFNAFGVKSGDRLRLRIAGSERGYDLPIGYVNTDRLCLRTTRNELRQDLTRRNFIVSIVRTPYDRQKSGVLLPDHPVAVYTYRGTLVAASPNIDFTSEPRFRGVWTPGTTYNAGDLINTPANTLAIAKVTHVAGGLFDVSFWHDWSNVAAYVDADDEADRGLFSVATAILSGLILQRPAFTVSATATIIVAVYNNPIGAQRPTLELQHTELDDFSLVARRAHPVRYRGEVYPTGGQVISGVDYVVDARQGKVIALSVWDPLYPARATYTWDLEITSFSYTHRGNFVAATFYDIGSTVIHNGEAYVCTESHFAVTFDPAKWRKIVNIFLFDYAQVLREVACWAADVLYDRETLYKNFGYLLAAKRPSSEQYRAFLRGVARLFVLGPTLERFESALNVMAGLPVIREQNEILRSYSSGIHASGNAGQVFETKSGRLGTIDTSGVFTAPNAGFLEDDVGAVIHTDNQAYTIVSVLNATQAVVTPVPSLPLSNLRWSYTHVHMQRRFRTGEYVFSDADRGGEIWISNPNEPANRGAFKIVAIENGSTVVLDAPFPLVDESGLQWKLSRSLVQQVITSRHTYTLPYRVPIRADIANTSNWDKLKFKAFEAISAAFWVSDYITNPTWWHNMTIPEELLEVTGSSGRRKALATMIEHILDPLDGALIGDPGLVIDCDDLGNPGQIRSGTATWFGGDTIVLNFDAQPRDTGRYVQIEFPALRLKAQFRIQATAADKRTLKLQNFPPPEFQGISAPLSVTATLPPLVFRHSVGYVMVDRFLKYHMLRIQVDEHAQLDPALVGEAVQLIREAKPAYTYVQFETPLNLRESIISSDSAVFGVGVPFIEPITAINNQMVVGPPTLLDVNDSYRFIEHTQLIPDVPGTYPIVPALPPAGAPPRTVRFYLVKGRFDPSMIVSGRRLSEGVDYTLDYLNSTITLLTPLPSPTNFHCVFVILRTRLPGDPLDPGETPLCVNGADPTQWSVPGAAPDHTGLIDRALQITISP
jgi:hypothetical protein